MTTDEIREILATVRPTEQEYFDAHSVRIVTTLLEENEELKRQVVTSIENFHAVAKEWEAAERRVEELEGELRTLTNERDTARIEPDCSKSELSE